MYLGRAIRQTYRLKLHPKALPFEITKRVSSNKKRKWPKEALIFDTESRITPDQSLTFGVYRRCELVNDNYDVKEEGLFYADDLPAH